MSSSLHKPVHLHPCVSRFYKEDIAKFNVYVHENGLLWPPFLFQGPPLTFA